MRSFAAVVTAVTLARLASSVPCPGQDRLGAVASENSVCSDIGINLLEDGGNAADALVGTVFCVGVTGMYHSGIGGGGFMIVRASNGSYEFIDFREKAPAAATQDMYNNNVSASLFGGLASGVPGELRGLAHLHDNYGQLPWSHVMAPAINLARYGFLVNKDMAHYWQLGIAGRPNFLVDDPTWALDFAPNGTLLTVNETMTRKRYADTLETIANDGPDAFYTGTIAETTIAAVQKANGIMTLEDLRNYSVAIRTPVQINYRGYKLTSTSAPSSGEVVLSALNIAEGYQIEAEPGYTNESLHLLDESTRFAYGERTQLGDPLYVPGLNAYQAAMLSEQTAAEIRSKISYAHTLNVSAYDPTGIQSLQTHGTSEVVAADYTGMAVSLTTTVNTYFGSQVMVPETGVIMNNEMNDFSIPGSSNAFGYIPSPANYIVPGKRPLSSISPVIVEFPNGEFYTALGCAGGSRIITANIQNLHHILDQSMTTAEALAQPRWHDQLVPNRISFEYAFNNQTVAFMAMLGHNVTWEAPSTTAQALRRTQNGTFEAAGEPRQLDSGGFAI